MIMYQIELDLDNDYFSWLQKPIEGPTGPKQDLRSFQLILEYVKALPVSFVLFFINIMSNVKLLLVTYPSFV